MDANVRRLKDIEDALKRANIKCTELRKKKKIAQEHLYSSMKKNGVEDYKGYTLKKVQPKLPAKRKPAKAKREDAINLFRSIGVDDPETFYSEFEMTQKFIPVVTKEVSEEVSDEDSKEVSEE
ncbi:MAG TPA: hypothetical protein PKD85_04235 [Saprospiraceae bacterium]|nr:hypothetical protein [Saprospiraceae bacterium]